MLTSLQIDARYDATFLKSLTAITGADSWGQGPGDSPDAQVIFFDAHRADDVTAALNIYDEAWLARIKPARIEAVAALRKGAVVNGFTFNGVPMLLDVDTENALSKAYSALSRAPAGTSIDWEVTRGVFASFDLATVAAISDAAFVHVQRCFTNARRLTALINAAEDLAALDAIDLESGWAA